LADKPTRVLLVRHGMNDYVKTRRLAGWTPGVSLNDYGRAQAQALADRLIAEPIAAIYSSPLERTVETAEVVARPRQLPVVRLDGIGETRVGEWTGQLIEDLSKTELWQRIQSAPSRARFPGGESFAEIQARMAATLDDLSARHPEQTILVVSHSDPIKLALAYYVGLPLDLFQRMVIDTASISELHFSSSSARLVRTNDCAHVPPEPAAAANAEPAAVTAAEVV
jgi:probable phosphoglycerate mutase